MVKEKSLVQEIKQKNRSHTTTRGSFVQAAKVREELVGDETECESGNLKTKPPKVPLGDGIQTLRIRLPHMAGASDGKNQNMQGLRKQDQTSPPKERENQDSLNKNAQNPQRKEEYRTNNRRSTMMGRKGFRPLV